MPVADTTSSDQALRGLYERILNAWNHRDAPVMAAQFAEMVASLGLMEAKRIPALQSKLTCVRSFPTIRRRPTLRRRERSGFLIEKSASFAPSPA